MKYFSNYTGSIVWSDSVFLGIKKKITMRNDYRYLVSILYIIRNLTKRDKAEINGPTAMKKKMVSSKAFNKYSMRLKSELHTN